MFDANEDEDTIKNITFPSPIDTNVLRIMPIEYHSNKVALRFEVIGYKATGHCVAAGQ